MLFVCTAVLCCAFILPSAANIRAVYAEEENKIVIGELTIDSYEENPEYKTFDAVQLKKLYDAILGAEGTGTIEEVKESLKNDDSFERTLVGFYLNDAKQNVTLPTGLSSEDVRAKNGGKDIYVSFGGIQWAVTYLTLDKNDHVILDLWQAESFTQSAFSGGNGGSAWYATGNGDHENLPCQIYSTSLIRSVALNSGTAYNVYNSDGLEHQSSASDGVQDENSLYAIFTMPELNGSLTNYIVKPSQVKYQEVESYAGECGQQSTNCPGDKDWHFVLANDAYGIPWKENYFRFNRTEECGDPITDEMGGYYINTAYGGTKKADILSGIEVNNKNGYADWQNDYLWLPSLTETGGENSINGIWDLSAQQLEGTVSCWLRSGAQSFANGVYYIDEYGNAVEPDGSSNTTSLYGVRPAIHLDLTKAEESAGIAMPAEDTTQFVYNGEPQTYMPEGFDSEIMSIAGNIQTDADEYEVTVTSEVEYCFANGESELKFDFVIDKAEPTVNPTQVVEKPFITDRIEDVVALSEGDTKGILSWKEQVPNAGTNEYEWKFVPTDTKNYSNKTGKISLYFREPTAIGISANLKDEEDEIYTSISFEELREKITVSLDFDSGAKKELSEYILSADGDKLTAGENMLTIKATIEDKTFDCQLIIKGVIEAEIIKFDFTFAQGGVFVYFDTPIEELKQLVNSDGENVLKVCADWNDGRQKVPVECSDYELNFKEGDCFTVGTTVIVLSCGGFKKEFSVAVSKKDYDTLNWKIENDRAICDGQVHNISVSGLPEGVTAQFFYNGEPFDGATEIGRYEITVRFLNKNPNYNGVENISATLTIVGKCYPVPIVDPKREYEAGGVDFTPDGIEEYKELVEFLVNGKPVGADYFKQTKIGDYCVTVKFKSDLIFFEGFQSSVNLEFSIVKRVVELPVFIGQIYYTGSRISPSVENFDKFDDEVMRFVKEASQTGKDAGEYTAAFALNDSEHCEWAVSQAVGGGEVRVSWSILRAEIFAESVNGKLPILRSNSYRGSFESVVAYRYFNDADCLNEISSNELKEGQNYFVRAELVNTDNFEVNSDSAKIFSGPFNYTVPDINAPLRKSVDKLVNENKVLFALTGVSLSLVLLLSASFGTLLCVTFIKYKRKTK